MLLRIKVPYNLLATKKKEKGISTDANYARNFLPTLFEFLWLHSISHEQSAGFHMKWKRKPIKAVNLGMFHFVSFSLCIIYIFVWLPKKIYIYIYLRTLYVIFETDDFWKVTWQQKKKKMKKPETNCIVFLNFSQNRVTLFTLKS